MMTDENSVDDTLAAAAGQDAADSNAGEPTAAAGDTPNAADAKSPEKAAGQSAGPRVKIGSQRQSGVRFRAEVKPPLRKLFRPAPGIPGPMRDLAAKSGQKPAGTQPSGSRPSTAPSQLTESEDKAAAPAAASPEFASYGDETPPAESETLKSRKDRPERGDKASGPREGEEAAPTLAKKVAETIADDFFIRDRTPLPTDLQDEVDDMLAGVSLDEMISDSSAPMNVPELEPDTRIRGRVAKIHRDDVFVDLGSRNQGVVPLHTFATAPEVGKVLEVIVRRFLAEEGLYEITAPGASVAVQDWSELSEGLVVDAVVTGHNKGGLEVEVNRIRGFIPASQVSNYRVEDFSDFVGQKFACVVTEANEDKRNLVLSRRAVLEREQVEAKAKLMAEIEPGQIREGVVRRITDFGAFVDIGGVDGLIHISQMSWDRIKHPSQVLTDGQKVKVRVDKVDSATGKIGLSYRDTFENPWTKAADKYPATSIVKGTVSRIMDFGAFVKLEPGIEGLVHISELSYKRVHRASDFVQEGQEVEAKVVSIDPDAQRISLSMRALQTRPETEAEKKAREEEEQNAADEANPPPPIKKSNKPLKGGLKSESDGAKFGLKW
jgi:predicted RNA-binding protein with RPS1 domain